jgi:hypothetical protein
MLATFDDSPVCGVATSGASSDARDVARGDGDPSLRTGGRVSRDPVGEVSPCEAVPAIHAIRRNAGLFRGFTRLFAA